VVEDDERVLAAHLELELPHQLDRGGGELPAGGDRTGEGQRLDVRRLDDRVTHHRAAAHDEVEHALGQAGAVEDVDDGPGRGRHQVGRLDHHGVAVAERRGDLPGGD